jgi:DNA-directed RNA polymerase beta' subunit
MSELPLVSTVCFYVYSAHEVIKEYDLSHKHKKEHQAMDLVRPDVLPRASSRHSGDVPGGDSESESEDEPAGESTFSDHDMDVDEGATTAQQMPKSASGKSKTARGRNERVMPPEECRQHLRRLFDNERGMCALIFGRHGPFAPVDKKGYSTAKADMFFMEVLLVPPTRFRPAAKMGEMLFEHQQNELLGKILQTSYRLRDINEEIDAASLKTSDVTPDGRLRLVTSFLDTLITLQNDVNSFIDSSKNPAPVRQGKLPPSGVKQLLEKKEGLFRKNMMVRIGVFLHF